MSYGVIMAVLVVLVMLMMMVVMVLKETNTISNP